MYLQRARDSHSGNWSLRGAGGISMHGRSMQAEINTEGVTSPYAE
jgi:hypothetical protein